MIESDKQQCDSSWAVPNSSKFFGDPLGGSLSALGEVPPWIGIEGAQHSPTEPIKAYLQSWSIRYPNDRGPFSSCMQLPHLSWQPLRRSLKSGFNMFQHVFQHIPHKYWTWISTVGFKQHKKNTLKPPNSNRIGAASTPQLIWAKFQCSRVPPDQFSPKRSFLITIWSFNSLPWEITICNR